MADEEKPGGLIVRSTDHPRYDERYGPLIPSPVLSKIPLAALLASFLLLRVSVVQKIKKLPGDPTTQIRL